TSRYQKVCDVFTNKVIACAKDTPLIEAVKLMRAHNVSAIFVKQQQQIIGVWTETDCLTLNFSNRSLRQLAIESVMSSPVLSVPSQQLLTETAMVFKKQGVRHLLVTDTNDIPSGVISITDIVNNQGLEHYLQFRPINDQYNKNIR
ncbi:CBS domain-containing protein, partial [Pseudoalteromonas sp. Angola-4]|uniref:CBS domain-containing protein n=1 Tax=Pseudoalteromonas sp. Angola-4 TaxID=3025335 RepID=UPI0023598668